MPPNRLYLIFALLYVIIFLTSFFAVPFIFLSEQIPIYVSLLSKITLLSVIGFILGIYATIGYRIKLKKLNLNFNICIHILFAFFLFIVFIIFITAEKIPIIESLKGADAVQLSYYRELFLKSRSGWQSSLVYINAIVTGAILPYMIAIAFQINHKRKYLFAILFFIYCISFIEKAYFIKLLIPVFFIYFNKVESKLFFAIKGLFVILCLLLFMFFISGTAIETTTDDPFFSRGYTPNNPLEQLLFRSIVIPIVTSLDALRVFIEDFNNNYFFGATSSLLAFLSGQERINFERSLFEMQFGQNLTNTGNANSAYIIEAFVNFGFVGVFLFSFLLGILIRFAINSKDIALLSLMPLLIFYLYNAGLIGTLFSNGFIILFIIVRFVKFSTSENNNFKSINFK